MVSVPVVCSVRAVTSEGVTVTDTTPCECACKCSAACQGKVFTTFLGYRFPMCPRCLRTCTDVGGPIL